MTDIRKLERELAYSAARSDIECICTSRTISGRYYGRWYQIHGLEGNDAEFVANAVLYLESRKLLKRHPSAPDLVQVLDE